jgi:Autophagy receptor ATG43
MSSIPLTIAETIQTASINRRPSPTHDITPSTSINAEFPAQSQQHHEPSQPQQQRVPASSLSRATSEEEDEGEEGNAGEEEEEEDDDDDEIPYSVIQPIRRKPVFPPLPDLRFEQSYLASIRGAQGWKGVLGVTLRDQVGMPFFFFFSLSVV